MILLSPQFRLVGFGTLLLGKGIQLNAPLKLSLERALEYIDVDEYVEATPKNLRLRKKVLDENARKRSEKGRSIKFLEE